MAEIALLKCSNCGREYAPGSVTYTCPVCGEVGTLDVLYDYAALRAHLDRDALSGGEASMWRFRALLPLADSSPVPPLAVGMTPLYEAPRLAADLGLAQAWVKDDGRNPTGSLKDRASALVVARASAAMPSMQASSISSLIVVAPTSSAPRKMKGKHRTLLTWFV